MPAEIKSTRSQFVALYEKKFPLYVASTKPYISTVSFFLDVVDAFPAGAATMAHAVLRKQKVSWFSYGEGANNINQGPGVPQKAPNLADTNLNTAKVTNGAEDFIIEGVSATMKAERILWAAAVTPAVADPDVQDAYNGKIKVKDPGALMSPPQFDSPTNMEDEIMAMISTQCAITLNFDKRGTIEIGRLDQIPEGAAKAVFRANGWPAVENRFRVPEGYIWRKAPKPDSQLYVTGEITDAAVIPVTAVGLGGAAAPLVLPTRIFGDVTMRLHGVGLSLPSANVS